MSKSSRSNRPSAKATTELPTAGLCLGPILGVETTPGQPVRYTCCVAWAGLAQPQLAWNVGGTKQPFRQIGRLSKGSFWRAEWQPSGPPGTAVAYELLQTGAPIAGVDGNTRWNFHLAPLNHTGFRFAYASCNGFSSAKLLANCDEPYRMWDRLREAHAEHSHHLLVMGGDQIYADALWEQDWMRTFAHLNGKAAAKAPVTPEQEQNLDVFYENLYLRQWRRLEVARVLAVLPSVMMWDDHDIFDGWGSFPAEQQNCPVFQRVFASARRAFELFQLRARPAAERLAPAAETYDFTLNLADTTFLVLDHRTGRTRDNVMTGPQLDAFRTWLEQFGGSRLLILSAVPMVYRNFARAEAGMQATPWQEELEDDLLDHWSARRHQRERVQLIYTLINRQTALKQSKPTTNPQWVLLSGDVHVSGVGVVWDNVRDAGLYQLISSGIAHPPPSWIAWRAIQLVSSDAPEVLGDGDLKAELLIATGAAENYLRTRNFLLAEIGTDDRLWFEWRCEDGQRPLFSV